MNGRICERCELPFYEQYCLGKRADVLKNLIEIYKYRSVRSAAAIFAGMLYANYGEFTKGKILVPLPTINRHIRERGFDHTKLLAHTIAERCGGRCKTLLERANNSVQVGKDENTRKQQAETAYAIIKPVDANREYVLVDDVWTTGSSILSACEVMKKAGATKISVIVLARS